MRISVVLCFVVAVFGCGAPSVVLTPQEALSQSYRALEVVLQGLARDVTETGRIKASVSRWRMAQNTARALIPAALFDAEQRFGEALDVALDAIEELQASLGDHSMTMGAKLARYKTALEQLRRLEGAFAAWGKTEEAALTSLKEVVVEPLYPKYRGKIEDNLRMLRAEIENLKSKMEKALGISAKP